MLRLYQWSYLAELKLTEVENKIAFIYPANPGHTDKVYVLETPDTLNATGKYTGKSGNIKVTLKRKEFDNKASILTDLKGEWIWKFKGQIYKLYF